MTFAVTHVMAFSDIPDRPAFSGAENHLFTLMHAQRANGIAVRLLMIVVLDGPRLEAKRAELRDSGIDVRVVQHRTGLRRWLGPLTRLAVLPRLVAVLHEKPGDIVHTHLPHASQLGRLAGMITRSASLVDTVHNDEPAFRSASWRFRFRVLDRRTAAYIAISDSVRRLLVDVGLPADKVHVVPYGVAEPGSEPDRPTARQVLDIAEGTPLVGFVGRLTPQKQLPVFLHALAQMPEIAGVIIGGGEEEAALRETAARLGAGNVRFAGPLENAAALMRAFDVFCLPSRWEGLGLVLLEAMWREVPIVASRAGAIPEVLDHGRCGVLVESGDVDGLVTAIRSVLGDPARRAALARAARKRVEEIYSVDQMVAGTSAVYASTLPSIARLS